MRTKKGEKPRPMPKGGRPKGVPNKLTTDLKTMILGALSDVGGQKYLAQCAIKQPAAFLVLVGKVLPLQVQANGADGVPLSIEWARAQPPLIEGKVDNDTITQPVDIDSEKTQV